MIESSAMSRAFLAAIPLVLQLAACGSPESGPPPGAATGSETDVSSTVPMRGIVSTTGDLTTFCECGAPAGRVWTMNDPRGELARAYASIGAKPGSGLYVELDGEPSPDGKALAWTRLVRARALGESIACDAPVFEGEFVASGNEPFWSIEIREDGIVLRTPEVPRGLTYPYALTRTETGAVVYATKTAGPKVSTLEIALDLGDCVDSMSGELRSFKAHVTLDGRTLSGCAFAGVPHGEFGDAPLDELNRFAGAYPRTVQLWKDSVVGKRLEELLGPTMKTFIENSTVQGPITKDDGVFYVIGSKPHRGGSDAAFFLADPASDTLAVIPYVDGVRRDFNEGGREVALPAEVAKAMGNLEVH
jgi:uncharacterized membrane protein